MPPEIPYPLLTPVVKFSYRVSPVSQKPWRGTERMKFPARKLIPLIVFILSSYSILRLLKIGITASSSPRPLRALPSPLQHFCSSPSACSKIQSTAPGPSPTSVQSSANVGVLTEKEFQVILNLVILKAPCNLLIFGLELRYLSFSLINGRGTTIFLEDDPNKIRAIKLGSNSTRIYKVDYKMPSKKAYKLLEQTRQNPACTPNSGMLQQSTCQLALTNLPQEVYEINWDIMVVDGPSGDSLEAPGRMATIYTASMIARAGNTTDVVVHDVQRTIEKWFSWEFLCEENLVSSKGHLWHFRLRGQSNSKRFCHLGTRLKE